MGADFIYGICQIPAYEDGTKVARDILGQVMKQRFLNCFTEEKESLLDDLGIYIEDKNDSEIEELIENYAEEVKYFYTSGLDHRDVGILYLENKYYALSGGMSWGDEPTDSFRIMTIIDSLGIDGKPVKKGEH